MRKVYTPPPDRSGTLGPILGAALLTLAVFLVLPLTQMVSSGLQKNLLLTKVDTAKLEAPPDASEEPPPPPPPEKAEEPPPPDLTSETPPLNLSVDLDVVVGSGGALAGYGRAETAAESASLLDTFNVADLEKQPELIASVAPKYPSELRKAKVEGNVTILFVLDENGRVEDARIDKSSRPEFEEPALEAVRKWKFKPGLKDGEPVRTYMKLPIKFSINS